MTFIYTLTCSKTKEIVYVGRTVDVFARRSLHVSLSKSKSKTSPQRVYMYFKKKKSTPILEILEEVEDSLANLTEKFWIEQFRQWGFPLQNTVCMNLNLRNNNDYASVKIDVEQLNRVRIYLATSKQTIGNYISRLIRQEFDRVGNKKLK